MDKLSIGAKKLTNGKRMTDKNTNIQKKNLLIII